MALTDTVVALAAELRRSGVPVSVAETADAVRALAEIPLEHRPAVKAALSATLVKESESRGIFERVFEVFFPPPRPPRRREGAEGTEGGGADGEGQGEIADLRSRLRRAIRERDANALREIAEQLVEEEAGIEPNADVSDDYYEYRARRNLDLEDLLSRLIEEDVAGKGMSMLERRLVEEDFEERMKRFSEQVTEEIRRRRRAGIGMDEKLKQQRRERPEEVDFLWAKDSDIEAMRAAIYPLGRRLALRLSQRRRRAHRGRLDVRKTLRRSLSTGGVMLEPRFRRPSIGKPELWVVCDISGSMRSFARFTLELVYALSTQFQRVRSFVFIDALDEITEKLEVSRDFYRALERIDTEASVVEFDGQSWYGNSLQQFWGRHGREVSPRTAVLILGDCRNNFRTSGAEALREVHAKARRVWWLNPEPRSYWNSADSIADAFVRHTDGMFECRNLRQLEDFVVRAM
ncbi:MAG: vWA domain-containing protein [Actinomycetota bacterium]